MSSIAGALAQLSRSSGGERSGLWVGRVESVDDPQRMNRVRVRVFMLHGDKRQTPTDALPWAEIGDFGGGGYDYGSGGNIYPVGSTVWVAFEMGDEEFPVVLAGRRGSATTRDSKNPVEFLTIDGSDESTTERPWLPPEGNELPQDIFDASAEGDRHPTRTVWAKSFKGHTILVEDRDGHEFLQIIDRAGQVLEMFSPVTAGHNEGNASQRGTRNATRGTQLPQDYLVNNRGYIRLVDVAGQEVILDGSENSEEIKLTSKNRQGSSIQQMTLSSAKGREKVELLDKQGNRFLLDPNSPTPVTISDYAGDSIEFDAENGVIRLRPANSLSEESGGSKVTRINGTHEYTVVGDDKAQVLGNKFLDVMNDLTASVAGLTSAVLTGPVRINVVNAQMSGAPELTAFSIDAANGAIKLASQVVSPPQAMELSTLAGDVTVQTLAGNLKCQTVAGNADVGTLAGITALNGTTVKLGTAATFKVPLGDILQQILTQLNTGLQTDMRIGNMGAPVPPSPALIAVTNALVSLIQTMLSLTVTVQP